MTVSLPATTPDRAPRHVEWLALLACGGLLLACVARLDPGTAGAPVPAERLLLNAAPVLAVWLLLLAMTRRALLSTWLALLALAGLYAANAAKLGALQVPLLPADFRFLQQPASALQLFTHYLRLDTVHAALLVAGLAITALLWRERRLRLLAGWRAALLGTAALGAGASLFAGAAPLRHAYESGLPELQPWSLADSAARTGLIGNLLLYHWQIGGGDVPAADEAAASSLLEAEAPMLRAGLSGTTSIDDLPDIVVVQSESLFDPARMRHVLSGRYLAAMHRLAARRATSGDLIVPTFAGGTVRTEFEVLTGAPLASLGGVQYPWLELDRERYPSLARVLGAHGYRSVAIHPNSASFWNRARAYPALGFDRFIDSAEFPTDRIVGLFTSDAALTDRVLAELPDDGPPQCVFAISMENHGPFDWRPGLDPARLAALPMPEELDADARSWLGNYLYLLDDADRELARLADTLAKRKRHTLLLFYGDHLPDLGPVYANLGFDDGLPATAQPTAWLLYDNRKARAHRLDTHAWMLPGLLLDAAGIHDDGWFDLLATLARSEDFDPADASAAAGIDALARLHLRDELDPVLRAALDLGDGGSGVYAP